ncbi:MULTISPECIES: TIGR03619 family F420-dependent LLM class oxidoreductase [unclassified Pseudofrankia]|uniref:TIGR03619 family F420-dependent LLM class oxidoreductase n=1 Tax=unclassified Pseudofrankia TaxID=2994372 RepID=UPI0008DA13E2|nr:MULTISPECIES: TIGR03619 family F420-dependent LLM class oxidoreductase [unclassified Pseudofrankia]MDT3442253.1 TIGR03619 family F420-dependent LLM class oxidoreductase [Pseudofrankia sp. BMG5.37]OHV43541.1 LLM class F420-dependent oxidoreductase [Pseudofrankia sp. BMG5.36]
MKPQLTIPVFTLAPDDPGTWQPMLDRVRAADRAGVDRVILTGEHVVFGENLGAYTRPELGGRAGGKQITGPDGHYLEPIVTMAMFCGMTSRIRFASNILLAALRRPIVLAKSAATLDVLSGGRLDLGVGVGWQREEYGAAGLDFGTRGRLLDHTLEVCQLLWSEQRASYSSPELSFENIHMMPKPVDPNGVPIWISGTVTPPAMRRLARFGTGWIPWGDAAGGIDALLEAIPKMRDAVAAFGRDPAELQVAGTLPTVADKDGTPAIEPTMEGVAALVEAGVTDLRVQLPVPDGAKAAEEYLAEWVAGFRAATA